MSVAHGIVVFFILDGSPFLCNGCAAGALICILLYPFMLFGL